MTLETIEEKLTAILDNLLKSRITLDDFPAASDHCWCTAISQLVEIIGDYESDNASNAYEVQYALINLKLLKGEITNREAIEAIEPYVLAMLTRNPNK